MLPRLLALLLLVCAPAVAGAAEQRLSLGWAAGDPPLQPAALDERGLSQRPVKSGMAVQRSGSSPKPHGLALKADAARPHSARAGTPRRAAPPMVAGARPERANPSRAPPRA